MCLLIAPHTKKDYRLIGDEKQLIVTARFTADEALAELERWDKRGQARVWAANYEPLLVADARAG